ncbi:MAG: 2-C-methyl-D-erythritol 4-phosphate cytidylyltransferase [Candidatus Omnitrophota bacterium]
MSDSAKRFNVGVVIVGAGKGKRLGLKIDKALLPLAGKPLFLRTVAIFENLQEIKQIVLVLGKRYCAPAKKMMHDKNIAVVEGGSQRQDSVRKGLFALRGDINYVLIHDVARPFVSNETLNRILKALKRYPAVICAVAAKDAVKTVKNGCVRKTLSRESLVLVQTPQGFKKELILRAYSRLKNTKLYDDAQAVELMGKKVRVVEGDYSNMKITYPGDIELAHYICHEKL